MSVDRPRAEANGQRYDLAGTGVPVSLIEAKLGNPKGKGQMRVEGAT
jgi:hypothetical protein